MVSVASNKSVFNKFYSVSDYLFFYNNNIIKIDLYTGGFLKFFVVLGPKGQNIVYLPKEFNVFIFKYNLFGFFFKFNSDYSFNYFKYYKRQVSKLFMFVSLLKESVLGVVSGYYTILNLFGMHYWFRFKKNKVIFWLGYSHEVECYVVPGVRLYPLTKNSIFFFSINKFLLKLMVVKIKELRSLDVYRKKGFLLFDELFVKKIFKKQLN